MPSSVKTRRNGHLLVCQRVHFESLFAFLSPTPRVYLFTVAVYDDEHTPPPNEHPLDPLDEVELELAAIAGVNSSTVMTYCMFCFVILSFNNPHNQLHQE